MSQLETFMFVKFVEDNLSSSSKTTQIWRLFAEDVGLSIYWFVEDNSISCDRWFIKDTHPGTGVESVENCGTIGRGIPSFI